ncbi:C40 family peptidase [Hymenobacter armeniacus]|uniref:C40 family peptidase n=1 Tax=Hymenobacter armeniacus TaxID=2771358 RepID=A0ABR8JT82_9BACT|nr:C40 family peptidase [Hymenobacter armeniacus]MBD2721154.1 C40 family peptidase [Hymenobacter armeniacus]
MRIVWLVFVGLIVAMALVLPRLSRTPAPHTTATPAPAEGSSGTAPLTSSFAALREAPAPGLAATADSVVAFGLAQRGTPYVYAGVSPLTGFDCSGFIMYTFARFGVAVPHSTALLIDVGRPVPRAEAQPGDIVVFTGTANPSTTPGHAGIVISRRGETPLRFVHASSSRREPFVKVSQVENSDYERRFMQVRRVLGQQNLAAARPAPTTKPAAKAPPVAALPARKVAVDALPAPAPALPQTLARKPVAHSAAPQRTAKKVAAKKPAVRKTVAKKAAPKKQVAPAAKRKTPVKASARK